MSKKHLSGLRVAHNADDFIEDREIVLTLADEPLLTKEGLNDAGDTLVNIDMAQDFKRKANMENAKKKKIDYDEMDLNKRILPHYDEAPIEQEGITLDSTGEYNPEKLKRLEAIRSKLNSSNKGNEISLDVAKNIASEYQTPEETYKFKVPKKRKTEKKSKDDILKFLEESLQGDTGALGTRETQKTKAKQEQEAAGDEHKADGYQNALDKARAKSRVRDFDEEYEDMERAIEMQRKKTQRAAVQKVEDVVKNLLDASKDDPVASNQSESLKPYSFDFNKNNEGRQELTNIDTSTEFLKSVPTSVDVERKKFNPPSASLGLRDSVSGTTSVLNVSMPTERLLFSSKAQAGLSSVLANKTKQPKTDLMDEAASPEDEKDNMETEPNREEMQEEVKFLNQESLGSGIAAALKNIREKGYLMDETLTVTGRAKDKTYTEELSKFEKAPSDRIKLEYRDETGRMMTPKEAFRYQCWIFHGKKPGKNKLERKRKTFENTVKQKSTTTAQLPTMRALEKAQKDTHQPYLILNATKK
jgi:U4/U6.U5 tri-snRNP-associated protein 1